MFGSLFGHTQNMFGRNGGFNNPTPQSAGSGSTPTNMQGDSNKSKWGGWPGKGSGGGPHNNSQWPTSWPNHNQHSQQQPQPQQPTTPPAPTTPPSSSYPAGSWQNNWELYQAQQLAGMAEAKRAAEMAKDQRERDWYAQNKAAKWFPHVERYLAQKYKHAPKQPGSGSGGGGGGGSSGGGSGGGGGTTPPPTGSSAAYTPGTFDRDPRPYT